MLVSESANRIGLQVTAVSLGDGFQPRPHHQLPHALELSFIPLGSYRMDMGFKLRQAKLINGMLCSSQDCQELNSDDFKIFKKVG